ncbi:Superfamily II DNA and RNA helicase [Parelusimicrobium proximum]
MPLNGEMQRALNGMHITIPTEVQARVIPVALEGRDILATSKTGTGKTLAFLIPLFTHLKENEKSTALILAPTRELSQQIAEVVKNMFGPKNPYKAALIIGGADIHRQFAALREKPRLIIGTSGRIMEHMQRKTIDLSHTDFIVLDETDRMLDMGFVQDINYILSAVPKKRRMLLFSATMPASIEKLSKIYLTKPFRVTVGETHTAHELITQNHKRVELRDKLGVLTEELDNRKGTVLIFTKTKRKADVLARQLRDKGYESKALHSDLSQNQRKNVLQAFRDGKINILVATDIASRGLDIDHITNVINYDVPYTPEEYIHRVGRTGRAGREGWALTLVTEEDSKKWKAVCNMLAGKKYAGVERKSNRVIKKINNFITDRPALPELKKPLRRNTQPKKSKPSSGAAGQFDFHKEAYVSPEKPKDKAPRNKYKKAESGAKPQEKASSAKPARHIAKPEPKETRTKNKKFVSKYKFDFKKFKEEQKKKQKFGKGNNKKQKFTNKPSGRGRK